MVFKKSFDLNWNICLLWKSKSKFRLIFYFGSIFLPLTRRWVNQSRTSMHIQWETETDANENLTQWLRWQRCTAFSHFFFLCRKMSKIKYCILLIILFSLPRHMLHYKLCTSAIIQYFTQKGRKYQCLSLQNWILDIINKIK